MKSELTLADEGNLKALQDVFKQNPAFGVCTNPNYSKDKELHESMLRLEQNGLVCRVLETPEYGIWWQAVQKEDTK